MTIMDSLSMYSLGSDQVNWYLLCHPTGLTVIDCGFPNYYRQLEQMLAKLHKTPTDVKAIVLTHAHNDHKGFAERLRRASGATVWVHEADRPLAESTSSAPPMGFIRTLGRRAIRRFMLHALLEAGATRVHPIQQLSTYTDHQQITIPGGSLRVIATPGHTPGHCSLWLEGASVLFSGDALVTMNLLTGAHSGPQLFPFNEDEPQTKASLGGLSPLRRAWVLPGHGKAWWGNIAEAIAEL